MARRRGMASGGVRACSEMTIVSLRQVSVNVNKLNWPGGERESGAGGGGAGNGGAGGERVGGSKVLQEGPGAGRKTSNHRTDP